MLRLTALIEREGDGYVATCQKLGVVSQGRTVEEARQNLVEAKEITMHRFDYKHILAAEIYGYSYAHYAEHLYDGHIRFSKLMPRDVSILERADREGWDPPRLAAALEIPEERVALYQRLYREGQDIADAPTAAEAFRRGVRYSIQHAVERGLGDKAAIERLVTQICYRAADLGFLLDLEEKHLSDYSVELREETEYDQEYWSKVLDQTFQEEKPEGSTRTSAHHSG